MEEQHNATTHIPDSAEELTRFTESYASFNRIVNSLQRQYLALKEEFSGQHRELTETNRKLADATHKNLVANEFLNSILDSLAAGIIAVDLSGRITHFNPAASSLLGIPVTDALGKPYRDIVPPGEPFDANVLRTVQSGRGVSAVERVVDLIDGTRLWVSVSTAILRDDSGKPAGAVEVLHNLTKTKRMEAEIARLNTLAALGEMAATIAHEVRNPLTAIAGYATFLKRDLSPEDPRQKMVTKISSGVETLNQIVTSLLNYTRFEEVNTEETRYDEFLHRTVEQFKYDHPELARGTRFNLLSKFGDRIAPVTINCDPMLLRQLFYNLFTNSIEACGGGARIDISCRKLPRQKATSDYGSRLILGLDETIVETIVTDSGPGLSEDAREKLFAPFFTTKVDGNGLGLAVGWKIIKGHGGDIIADNCESGGARFTILLPIRIDPGLAGM
jgi:PAS domain S-box-containing protein